jgi:uroporphyrinogen-III synthase
MRILITRPADDSQEIAARLAAMGHRGIVAPLLVPRYQASCEPDFSGVQAILITSANGVRALVRATKRRDLPVFAVGPQTTAEARDAGFANVRNADGNAHDLARCAAQWATPDEGALLHVCSDEAPGTLAGLLEAAGFSVCRAPLYRIEAATQLPRAAADALAAGEVDAAMFFSPRSAAVFRDGLAQIDPGLAARLTALCISTETAAALVPLTFAAVRVAARPNQDALLALVE